MPKQRLVESITLQEKVAKVVIKRAKVNPRIVGQAFQFLADNDISVLLIAQSAAAGGRVDLGLVVYESQATLVQELAETLLEIVGGESLIVDKKVVLVSVHGSPEMAQTPGIAARVFGALSAVNVKPEMITTSADTISFIVKEPRAQDAYFALMDEFELDEFI